ncbi:hypothetical protein AAG570_006259 [Ranatra chinensis]|uniref:Tr-type G domain-containing protein n=1 Tax=Ranatra chinensis TaxID=642074 RepID=A0ABD0ZAI2_9HEMI
MRLLNSDKLLELQRSPENIRNICILAHVDHGKTTLADSLIASNGIISSRMSGKLRYMDSRKDEQERGITMKSSSISLYYNSDSKDFLINLIDSPGHVDFSSEVSTAVRLCDGAIIVVDVVEGVCPQTQVALKQAWFENIKPVLVLNKIDRLILEMKLAPLDAYVHLTQVLEKVNAVMGHLFTTDVLSKNEKENVNSEKVENVGYYDWSTGLEQADDSTLYFSPDQGNVIFGSAIDGWGFCVNDFAKLYSKKLEVSEDALRRTLWGNYYFNSKNKKIMKGAQEKAKKPLFVQLVLENIWSLYDIICIRKDKEKLSKIVESLGIKVTSRDLRHTDSKVQLHSVCSQWLPLANSVLDMVCNILPAANQLSMEKVEKLMCNKNQGLETLPKESQALAQAFINCSSNDDVPVIVFISKMFHVDRKSLPQNRPLILTEKELAERKEQARLRHSLKMLKLESPDDSSPSLPTEESVSEIEEEAPPSDIFIAFARVYSGVLRKGQKVYVLGPKHDPASALKKGEEIGEDLTLKDLKHGQHVTKATISELYLMMGREFEILSEAPAGNIVGIGGLEEHVLKSATLSTEICCPSFSEMHLMALPILRVAVEPAKPSDLPLLVKGLKLLNQADACVQVIVQETGEHVIVTAGEVHLERCLDDLRSRYANVDIIASEPIVPFRETIVPPPVVDMVNEAIHDENVLTKKLDSDDDCGVITMYTSNKQSLFKICCVPLPSEVTDILENNTELIKILDSYMNTKSQDNKSDNDTVKEDHQTNCLTSKTLKAIENLKACIGIAFERSGGCWSGNTVNKIWCFGPRRCGPNILINEIEGYEGRNIWDRVNLDTVNKSLYDYESSFINGFQLATLAGPLCEEPMMGVAFVVQRWTIEPTCVVSGNYGPLSGQIVSTVKEACRKSFQAQPQRLMAAMYSCSIQANAEVLGKCIFFC